VIEAAWNNFAHFLKRPDYKSSSLDAGYRWDCMNIRNAQELQGTE
jgi:hypothetical protein